MSTLAELASIHVIRSPWVKPGDIYVLGSGERLPDNWPSMTEDERIRWAVVHGRAVVIRG